MTVAEYLRWNGGTSQRHELVRGVPVAMAPPKGAHAEIALNLLRALDRRLDPPCRPMFGAGIARDEADDECRIPDLFVTCEATPEHLFMAPSIVVEILSPTTEKDDRTEKLDFYKSLPTVQAVLHVWQERRRVELHLRQGDRWSTHDLIGTGGLVLPGLVSDVSLDEIYAGIELPTEGVRRRR
jgi:Uma2 family endonuclease